MPLSWSKFYIPREIRISQCHIHAALVFPPSYLLVLNLFLSKQFCRRDAEDSVSRLISTLSNIRRRKWVPKPPFYYIIAHSILYLLSTSPPVKFRSFYLIYSNKLCVKQTYDRCYGDHNRFDILDQESFCLQNIDLRSLKPTEMIWNQTTLEKIKEENFFLNIVLFLSTDKSRVLLYFVVLMRTNMIDKGNQKWSNRMLPIFCPI